MQLKNKVVVITGASSGIGEACAKLFSQKGAFVVLAARRRHKLKEVAKKLPHASLIVQCDVRKEADLKKLMRVTQKKCGAIDILLNNAGRGFKAPLQDITTENWNDLIATNVTSVLIASREAYAVMRKQKTKGHILTISSMAGRFGLPHYAAYCASKHAVCGMMKSLKWELRMQGIFTSTIHPGRVKTEFFKAYTKQPLAREMLMPRDIAEYVVALAERKPVKALGIKLGNVGKRILGMFAQH